MTTYRDTYILKNMTTIHTTPILLNQKDDDVRNLERIVELLKAANPDMTINKTVAVRVALRRAVAILELEAAALPQPNGKAR